MPTTLGWLRAQDETRRDRCAESSAARSETVAAFVEGGRAAASRPRWQRRQADDAAPDPAGALRRLAEDRGDEASADRFVPPVARLAWARRRTISFTKAALTPSEYATASATAPSSKVRAAPYSAIRRARQPASGLAIAMTSSTRPRRDARASSISSGRLVVRRKSTSASSCRPSISLSRRFRRTSVLRAVHAVAGPPDEVDILQDDDARLERPAKRTAQRIGPLRGLCNRTGFLYRNALTDRAVHGLRTEWVVYASIGGGNARRSRGT